MSEDGAGEDDGDDDGDVECKRRRDSDTAIAGEATTAAAAVEANSAATPSCSSPDTSLNESGFESAPTSPDQQVCGHERLSENTCLPCPSALCRQAGRQAGRLSRAIAP